MKRVVVEEIKSRLSILDCIEQYIKVEKAGKNYRALCPFHSEKSPSFYISTDRDTYYCFGCGKKGDIFSFVGEYEGLDFKTTLKQLAEKTGVPITDYSSFDTTTSDTKKNLYDILETATQFFEQELKKSQVATDYLKKRNLHKETMDMYRLGFAPSGWDNLRQYLERKGFAIKDIENAGLIKTGQYKSYDRFRNRIMFPFMDTTGRVIGFSGRIIDPKSEEAKYINSPESILFVKNKVLYGLYQAKDAIRRHKYIIIVEGQMDVLMTAQSGIGAVVASSGTAFSSDEHDDQGATTQLGIIKRFTSNMYLAFDNDKAGIKAMYSATLGALGSGFSVYCIPIVGGKDMADIAIQGSDAVKKLVTHKKDAILFFVEYLKQHTTDKIFYKSISEKIWPLIEKISNKIEQAHVLHCVAKAIDLPEQIIVDDFKKFSSDKRNIPVPKIESNKINTIQEKIFGLIFYYEQNSFTELYTLFENKLHDILGDDYEKQRENHEIRKDELIFLIEKTFSNEENLQKDSFFLFESFEKDYYKQKLEKLKNEMKNDELLGIDTQNKLQEVAVITKKYITR